VIALRRSRKLTDSKEKPLKGGDAVAGDDDQGPDAEGCAEGSGHFFQLPVHQQTHMLGAMRTLLIFVSLALSTSAAWGQGSKVSTFDVASVRPSQHTVGPDYNNQFTYLPNGISGRNVTLKRLLAEAYHLQLNQISGPNWLGQSEYDVDAKTADGVTRDQLDQMLRSLVAERFHLAEHSEMREMRVYELVTDKSGPTIHAMKSGESEKPGAGMHFHGDLGQFADLLAMQLSIPAADNPTEPVRASPSPTLVLDKTGLPGVFDFNIEMRPELGTDGFTSWQRALQGQLGLKIESRKESVPELVVDDATKVPAEN
jgi:uncharacterized protein (TIGR03435 family)